MPKIYEYFGLIFFFYSDEHEPIHIHVSKAERETVFEIIMENGELKELRVRKKGKKMPLTDSEQNTADKFIRVYLTDILKKWTNFFVWKKKIRATKITKKI